MAELTEAQRRVVVALRQVFVDEITDEVMEAVAKALDAGFFHPEIKSLLLSNIELRLAAGRAALREEP